MVARARAMDMHIPPKYERPESFLKVTSSRTARQAGKFDVGDGGQLRCADTVNGCQILSVAVIYVVEYTRLPLARWV